MNIFILLFLLPTLGYSFPVSKYVMDWDYCLVRVPPGKYLISLFPPRAPVDKDKVNQKLKGISFFKSSLFKEKIGSLKKDGFYLNGKKVCKRAFYDTLADLYLPLNKDGQFSDDNASISMGSGMFCESIGLYTPSLGSGSFPFFIANLITDKYVEIGEKEKKFFLRRSDFLENVVIRKPTVVETKELVINYEEFERYRLKLCNLFKLGTSDKILDFLKKEGTEHNLEDDKILKRGTPIFEAYRKDLTQICNYEKLWALGGLTKYGGTFWPKSSYFINKEIDSENSNFSGEFGIWGKGRSRISNLKYPRQVVDKKISVDEKGNITELPQD